MPKILVVDDEEMNRDLCSRRLRRSGFDVVVASSGPQALDLLHHENFDLVLLDQMMPGMSGLEVLHTVRLEHSLRDLPIIMVTAVTDGVRIAEALDSGANDYVTKPVDFTVALARIRSQLSRTQTENALQRSEERYALAARGANYGLWDWDLDRKEIYYSSDWKSLLGYSKDELSIQEDEWFSRVHPRDRAQLSAAIDGHLKNESLALQCDCRMKHKDGTYRWMTVRGVAVRDEDGRPHRMVGSQSDVTDKATIDTLTGLPNRVLFEDRLHAAFERSRTDSNWHFAVLFLDMDRFKIVNDSLGHGVGDKLLVAVAHRIRYSLRGIREGMPSGTDSLVARMGGDQFAVLLENIPDQATAEGVAQRLTETMNSKFMLGSKEVYCTLSIGLALPLSSHSSEVDLLHDADTAMHAAKDQGKARWATFESSMLETQQSRLQLDTDLRKALENSEFDVYYQPRVLLDTGEICGFEALVRWNHPTRGLVFPSEFIPAAEENGLIHAIGMWMMREACRQTQAWRLQFPKPRDLDVAVNLSVSQCHEPRLVEQVSEILRETGLPPSCLHLELTESLLLDNLDKAKDILIALKNLGVGLKIDDFGTGYSSLKYLTELPFDTIKIDRSFIFEMNAENQDSVEIVRTILLMAEGLKMGVIAEGIETFDHVLRLREMGCRFGQGYFFYRPVSASATEKLLSGPICLDALFKSASASALKEQEIV